MSITAYTGLPRHGKSYGAFKNVIIPALKKGRTVVSNIPLTPEGEEFVKTVKGRYLYYETKQLDGAKLIAAHVKGAIAVWDEVWRWWPAGMKAVNVPADQNEYFTMHGHNVGDDGFTNEIVLVTQDLSQIAIFIRDLVEQTFRVEKLLSLGLKKKYRVDFYRGRVTGQNPPKSSLIRSEYGTYDLKIYCLYKSHTESDTGEAGNEDQADDRGNLLKGWRFKLTLIAIPVAIFGLGFGIHNMYAFKDKVTKKTDAPPGQLPAGAPSAPLIKPPLYSKTWRLVGRIIINETVYFLANSDTGARRVPLTACDRDADLLNWRCHVDDEIATEWSGPTPPLFNQYVGVPATPQAIAAVQ